VVERGPEKAGVGGSIPSLATTSNPKLSAQTLNLSQVRLQRFCHTPGKRLHRSSGKLEVEQKSLRETLLG
jgi:hypothetical protein